MPTGAALPLRFADSLFHCRLPSSQCKQVCQTRLLGPHMSLRSRKLEVIPRGQNRRRGTDEEMGLIGSGIRRGPSSGCNGMRTWRTRRDGHSRRSAHRRSYSPRSGGATLNPGEAGSQELHHEQSALHCRSTRSPLHLGPPRPSGRANFPSPKPYQGAGLRVPLESWIQENHLPEIRVEILDVVGGGEQG